MNQFIDFISLQDPTVRNVVIGSILLAISSSIVGCFTFLRKRALVGDAVAHAVLPGICLAFIIGDTKNPAILLIGAFITGWLSLVFIDYMTSKTRISQDTAIGLVLSVFFGIGVFLLTLIQHMEGRSNQSGLENFLFGSAIAITKTDLYTFGFVALVLITTVFLLLKEFTLLSFDEQFAQTIGFPVKTLRLLLTSLTVFAVVIGIQSVGVVLMSAMLITPAAAARFLTNKLQFMILIAAGIGAVSGLSGAYISYTTPSPTGPWIVLILSMIAIFTFFFSPYRGIAARLYKQYQNKVQIREENLLKALFQIGERENNFYTPRTKQEIMQRREMAIDDLNSGLRSLKKHGYIKREGQDWVLTIDGKNKGQRVTKLHRLWEVYLTRYLRIAPDHVHEDAETIEHIITPEIEKQLEEILQYPVSDPHQTTIPYRKKRKA